MNKYFVIFCLLLVVASCKKEEQEEETPLFQGVIEKAIVLGGSSNETLQSIAKTNDGGFICVGNTRSDDGDIVQAPYGDNDYWVLKFDSNTVLEWSKVLGGSDEDMAQEIIQTNDGGYVISGYSKSSNFDVSENNGQKDIWIVKLGANGTLLWQKPMGFLGDDEAFSIIETNDGGLFTVGYLDVTASGGQGNDDGNKNINHGVGDIWGIKLDTNGNIVWRRYFGGSNNDRGYSVVETDDANFIIAGVAESTDFDITNPKGGYDIWAIQVSSLGNLMWEKSFGGAEIDNCFSVIPTADGNFFLVGDTRSSDQDITQNNGFSDIWLIKIAADGNMIWQKNYGGSSFDSSKAIYNTEDGNYIIAGNSRSDDVVENKGQNDVYLIKIDPNGSILWQDTFGGSAIDVANDLIETSDNAIIVVGDTNSDDFDFDTNNGFTDAFILKIK